MEEKEELTFDDIDILESIGSDICESVRDLIYSIKTIKNDVDVIKKRIGWWKRRWVFSKPSASLFIRFIN